MQRHLRERVEYGRAVRRRALCLMDAHGPSARLLCSEAATVAGLPVAERHFLQAVEARIARLQRGAGHAAIGPRR